METLRNKLVRAGDLVQHTKRASQYHDLWQYRLIQEECAHRTQPEHAGR